MYSTRQATETYQEFDASVGDSLLSDILSGSGTSLVMQYEIDEDKGCADVYGQHRAFEEIPLDMAFSDGGWNVMAQEKTLISSLYNDGVSLH
tara:strand:- start:173 stop:448 length:276 start_codon:yes stop_codon:yes gene_type:complete